MALTWQCFGFYVGFMYLHLSQSKDKITVSKADFGPLPQRQSKNEEQYREYTANDWKKVALSWWLVIRYAPILSLSESTQVYHSLTPLRLQGEKRVHTLWRYSFIMLCHLLYTVYSLPKWLKSFQLRVLTFYWRPNSLFRYVPPVLFYHCLCRVFSVYRQSN